MSPVGSTSLPSPAGARFVFAARELKVKLIAQYREASPPASNHAFANDGRVVSNFIVQAVKAGKPKLPIWIL
jgi:hypothetical protein